MSKYPPRSSDSSKLILTRTGLKGDQGDPALYVILQTPVIGIPCDNDGSNPILGAAISEVHVLKAGVLQTGWTLAYTSGFQCTGTVNNTVEPRLCYISTVSGAMGWASFTATKSGEITQTFKLYFVKVPEGADGPTGSTGAKGDTGAAGAAGAAGADGTGLVVVHKTMTVEAGDTVTKSDYGDGTLQLDYGAAHGLVVGDWVRVVQTGVYDDNRPVHTVVDSDNIKLDIAYDATAGTVTAYDMKDFQSVLEIGSQFVAFNEVIPQGAKVLEFQIICTDDNSGAIWPIAVRIGTNYTGNLTEVIGSWLNGDYVYQEGVVVSRDRRSTISMNIAGDQSLYIQAIAGYMDEWSVALANYQLELFVAYIAYPLGWTP